MIFECFQNTNKYIYHLLCIFGANARAHTHMHLYTANDVVTQHGVDSIHRRRSWLNRQRSREARKSSLHSYLTFTSSSEHRCNSVYKIIIRLFAVCLFINQHCRTVLMITKNLINRHESGLKNITVVFLFYI